MPDLRAGRTAGVVRQAVRARLAGGIGLGQDGSWARPAGRCHRRHARALRRGLRAHHGRQLRSLSRGGSHRVSSHRFVVNVMPKPGILDPQGRAVEQSLPHLDVSGVSEVRVGRRVELTVEALDIVAARAFRTPGGGGLRQPDHRDLGGRPASPRGGRRMRVGVVVFPVPTATETPSMPRAWLAPRRKRCGMRRPTCRASTWSLLGGFLPMATTCAGVLAPLQPEHGRRPRTRRGRRLRARHLQRFPILAEAGSCPAPCAATAPCASSIAGCVWSVERPTRPSRGHPAWPDAAPAHRTRGG